MMEQIRDYAQYDEDALYVIMDEGPYDKLYYYRQLGSDLHISHSKRLIIEELDNQNRKEAYRKELEKDLFRSGFRYVKKAILFDVKASELPIEESWNDSRVTLCTTEKHRDEVIELWDKYMDPFDVTLDHRNFLDDPEVLVYVVLEQDEVVSTLYVTDQKSRSQAYHLATREDQRGKGLASVIYRYWYYDMAKRGVKTYYSWIDEENKGSIRLHERLGFHDNGKTSVQYCLG